jgi:hypothetical protein
MTDQSFEDLLKSDRYWTREQRLMHAGYQIAKATAENDQVNKDLWTAVAKRLSLSE